MEPDSRRTGSKLLVSPRGRNEWRKAQEGTAVGSCHGLYRLVSLSSARIFVPRRLGADPSNARLLGSISSGRVGLLGRGYSARFFF